MMKSKSITGKKKRLSGGEFRAGIFYTGIALFCGCSGLENGVATQADISSAIIFVGAGDIASRTSNTSPQFKTAEIIESIIASDPNTIVFTTGDNAYPHGAASNFSKKYDPSWGRFRSRTYPTAGNHDWHTPNAKGYLDYFCPSSSDCRFPARAERYYYSYQAGTWHAIALDSELSMKADSPQLAWLKEDLATHPNTCALAYWHKPYFTSSAKHESFSKARAVWDVLYANGVDIVLAGHNHHYERFAPQDPDGSLDMEKGIRQFVVGSGGAGLYYFKSTWTQNSEKRLRQHGVLKLILRNGGYDWEFIDINNTVLDSGSDTCSKADSSASRGIS